VTQTTSSGECSRTLAVQLQLLILMIAGIPGLKWSVNGSGYIRNQVGDCPLAALARYLLGPAAPNYGYGGKFNVMAFEVLEQALGTGTTTAAERKAMEVIILAADYRNDPRRQQLLEGLGLGAKAPFCPECGGDLTSRQGTWCCDEPACPIDCMRTLADVAQ
jgi:hypothetical protein